MSGCVFLVGAGPGDPALVSVRARHLVSTADVLVYDRLIPPSLLDESPAGCERIDAGKTAGHHTLRQHEINATIVDRALGGARVVRVKGGDPFLFGRGGEEALACRAAGVAFEVVPGVSSALSVPAYAGIPVTHRGISDSVTVVTATPGAAGNDGPDMAWLAQAAGTVVFLMGLGRVGELATGLVRHGAPAGRPVAVISRGTEASQRTVVGTLATIGERVEAAALVSPGLIVVGDVVLLRDELEWFERRPLFGVTVAVTRARPQASVLVNALSELGATVVECPTIRIEELAPAPLDAELASIAVRDMVIFTSRNGVETFFDRLRSTGADARALGGVRVAAIGRATAAACAEHGVRPDIVPTPRQRTGAGLAQAMSAEPLYGASVLLVRAQEGDSTLVDSLRSMGAMVTVLPVYRTVVDEPAPEAIDKALQADCVTFASASTVANFARCMPAGSTPPPAVVIGPVTRRAAIDAGFRVVGQAREPSVASLAAAVLELSSPREAVNAAVRENAGARRAVTSE